MTQSSLRERIRASGGFYRWWNSRLIRLAGPAQLGRKGEPPPAAVPQVCPVCGHALADHDIDRSTGPRTFMRCP